MNINQIAISQDSEENSDTATNANQSKIKCLIKGTLYNSTAQAIITIKETPCLTLKCFLFVCVILSSGLCSYLIIELIW